MPVYEYRCRACNHEFEITQAMSEDALVECPECGGELRKVFSPVGIAFKGSGFYKTDSGSRSGSPKAGRTTADDTSKSGSDDSGGSSSSGDSASSASGDGGSKKAATTAASE